MVTEDDIENIVNEHSKKVREWLYSRKNYDAFLSCIKETLEFVENLDNLQTGRDIFAGVNLCGFSIPIINSATLTLKSVHLCAKEGHFADIATLLRKYRDDMFFYLYIIAVDDSADVFSEKKSKYEGLIEKWKRNEMSDLKISDVLKVIAKMETVQAPIVKYNLKNSFESIATNLNNYVHSNGMKFYNRRIYQYSESEIEQYAVHMTTLLRYITVSFTFIIALARPQSIMAEDYIDYLDCDITPPDDSQYWVAPFIVDFFEKHIQLLGDDCMRYLEENSCMDFDKKSL